MSAKKPPKPPHTPHSSTKISPAEIEIPNPWTFFAGTN
jgi:hypothetical protein